MRGLLPSEQPQIFITSFTLHTTCKSW